MKRPDEDHVLLCEITEEDALERGDQLAAVVASEVVLKADREKAAKTFKDREDFIKDEKLRLSEAIRTRKEDRQVLCSWFVEGVGTAMKWVLRRTDTKRVISSEPVTAADRQSSLFPSGGTN